MLKKFSVIYSFTASLILFGLMFHLILPARVLSEKSNETKRTQPANKQNSSPLIDESFGKIPVYFEENQGQFDKRVKYFARGTSGYSLFLTGIEAVYVLQEKGTRDKGQGMREDIALNPELKTPNSAKAVAVYMRLTGANENAVSTGLEEMPHNTNYFKGEESNWRTDIPNFRQIRMENIYQDIDAVWKGKQSGAVQYDFIVKPNADPDLIEWEIEGAEAVKIDEKGDLLIKTEYGEIRQQKPFTYQEETNGFKQEIESHFKIKSTHNEQRTTNKYRISFELGNYDRSKVLTIDPSVNLSNPAFSTFLGGELTDSGSGITVDRAGNIYVTGATKSQSFPTTAGSFDTTHNGNQDVFITKMNASGSSLVYSTFIGGSLENAGEDIVVDSSGNVFVTGFTLSTNYPTTAGAFDTTHNGDFDVFVSKLNTTGSSLIYSTFIGGSNFDKANGIEVDSSGNVFVAGIAQTGYPTTAGAFDTTRNGGNDAFVSKLNTTGSSLIYSTFIGGGDSDGANGIEIDSSGNVFVAGFTLSTNYPTTAGAFDTTHNGNSDVFVSKLNTTGSSLVYSTFIGGSFDDSGRSIAVDTSGNVFVTGSTETGYPTTAGAFDTTHNGNSDAFVSKLNTTGSSLVYSTFIGGSGFDTANGIEVDSSGNVFITGITPSTDYPTTAGAFDTTYNGGNFDAFVSKLNTTGSSLVYSTFIGGGDSDGANGIAVDSSGNAFVTGSASGADYPTTPDAFQTDNSGSLDAFITKLGDFSIAGQTLDYDGNPIPNVRIALSGASSGFVLTDASGFFGFFDTAAGNFAVSATRPLYAFNPGTFQFPNLPTNQNLTFVGQPVSGGPTAAYAALGGTVESTAGNVGLPNTKLTLIDTVRGSVSVVMTDANGNYEFESVITGAFYLVVAEREGYNFAPQIFEINHSEENLNLDFLASPNAPRPVNDFDGDGKTDLAVFRPENGVWYVWNTQDNSVDSVRFGLAGDLPVASDYDGDNRTDIAVYRPSEGNWYWLDSSDGEFHAVHFGQAGDLPVQADFDGDNKTDLAVYRPSTGVWHQLMSENNAYQSIRFGIETDIPVSADYDSDGKADLSVFRDGIWYRMRSSDSQVEGFQFGLAGDKPQVGDFDGDGRMDTAVYRPSNGTWYWLESSDGDFQAKQFGAETDTPVPADYNGDGRFEQAIFRAGIWFVLRSDNSYYSAEFGSDGDVPIPSAFIP